MYRGCVMAGERVPLLARVAGSRVLGPRPGKAIVSFWQGIVEIVLRAVALVLLLVVLIAPALAVARMRSDLSVVTNPDLSQGSCLVVILVCLVGAILEGVQIVLRFINIGVINMTFRIYGVVDIIVVGVVCVLLVLGSVLTAYTAHLNSSLEQISIPLGVTAGLCYVPVIALVAQGVWMLVFVIFKWNKHVVTYTIKDAVFG